MPALTKYTVDDILTATIEEVAVAGMDGASIASVARRVGAPSGSIYHRFPTRQHLLGALWTSIAASYRDALFGALDAAEARDLPTRIVEHTFDWVEADPARAEVLMRMRTEDFAPGDWPEEVVAAIGATNEALADEIGRLSERLGTHPLDTTLAIIDIPAAAARRSLLLGDPAASAHLRRSATELVATLLRPAGRT